VDGDANLQRAIETDGREPREQRDETVLLVGEWRNLADGPRRERLDAATVVRCATRLRACQLAVTAHLPDWLLLGEGTEHDDMVALAQAARLIVPTLLIAVLATDPDWRMCERWLRRGCSAYLPAADPVDRVMRLLRFARQSGVVVVDRGFHEVSSRRRQEVAPLADLTRREREVLDWLRTGRLNREIARELGVTASTIDFHVRNVLEKLGARNRVEAVSRADMLGL
jgi:DNA-binding NarL/FixJ family response regulator